MNLFPEDFDANLTGFGGDPGKNRDEHRNAIKRTPVILVHGNAGHSAHPKWGMETLKGFLKQSAAGYEDAEIWAMDYLGENNTNPDLSDPHRRHIAQFRTFVDRVREYLGVERLDFVAHSLGCGMVNGYLRGLQPDGQWNNGEHRLGVVSTFISLAGATYGLGLFSTSEFQSGSDFETESHRFDDVADDTPDGSNEVSAQQAPVASWKQVTRLDTDDPNQVRYVAVTSINDFVDAQNRDTGRREGADVNSRFDLGGGIDGHEKIIKSQTVFDSFRSYLNKNPPVAPATIEVDKDSGSYGPGLQIVVSITPATVSVNYVAERVTKQFNGGFIERTVAETKTGTLSSGQAATLAADGEWEVVFRAAGAEDVQRTYGVNVTMPQLEILTDNAIPFRDSLDVSASTTGGILYHSSNRENWAVGSVMSINRATTVSFIAIDSDGIASPVVSRAFEKAPSWEDRQTATLTQHFIAGRLTVDQYVAMGLDLGFNAVITLYLIDGKWVLNPTSPQVIRTAPLRSLGLAAARRASSGGIAILTDRPSGEASEGFDVTITASGPSGEPVTVYYTKDGTDPSDKRNPKRRSFDAQKAFAIRRSGHHGILCYAEDAARNGVFESFAWAIDSERPSMGRTGKSRRNRVPA